MAGSLSEHAWLIPGSRELGRGESWLSQPERSMWDVGSVTVEAVLTSRTQTRTRKTFSLDWSVFLWCEGRVCARHILTDAPALLIFSKLPSRLLLGNNGVQSRTESVTANFLFRSFHWLGKTPRPSLSTPLPACRTPRGDPGPLRWAGSCASWLWASCWAWRAGSSSLDAALPPPPRSRPGPHSERSSRHLSPWKKDKKNLFKLFARLHKKLSKNSKWRVSSYCEVLFMT